MDKIRFKSKVKKQIAEFHTRKLFLLACFLPLLHLNDVKCDIYDFQQFLHETVGATFCFFVGLC